MLVSSVRSAANGMVESRMNVMYNAITTAFQLRLLDLDFDLELGFTEFCAVFDLFVFFIIITCFSSIFYLFFEF